MLRRNIRLRREYLYRKSLEGKERLLYEKKRKIREALEEGKPFPTELRNEEVALRKEIELEDELTAVPRTHIDDEYANASEVDPKILITTSRDPSAPLTQFAKELKIVFPNAQRMNRGGQVISEIIETCRAHEFTDVILVHEHRGVPDGLIISHLPFGPTAYFGLLNVVTRHEIRDKKAMGTMPEAYPHIILNNFTTKLGERTANILKATNPSIFCATHSASLTLFSTQTMAPTSTISSFRDVVTCASFRCDGLLVAASDLSGLVQVFDVKTRTPLRKLRSHSRPVQFVQYPVLDKLHLVSGGDDAVVKYWDVASQTPISDFLGHKDYVRCGACSPASMDMFITGSYDHTVKLWDARTNSKLVLEVNHGKPVEDVIFLPSGGLVATAGGNSVKIWDVIGGGKMVCSMESHNKTVTSLCVGKKLGQDSGEELDQFRILSVALDGYMKVFDYSKMKVTHSMRFPTPLMSVGFSPDCSTRVIGTSNGILYAGKRKTKETKTSNLSNPWSLGTVGEPQRRVLRPSHFRYFHRGQGEKPTEGDYLVMKPKKVKLTEHDKLLKKFRHKDALVSVLAGRNPENVVAVMEELVARKKLLKCVSNLDREELGLLLVFLQKHSTLPRYSSLLMGLTRKVLELRSEDVRASGTLKDYVRNLKRSVDEEIRIQQSLLEIQGIISPLLRIAGR